MISPHKTLPSWLNAPYASYPAKQRSILRQCLFLAVQALDRPTIEALLNAGVPADSPWLKSWRSSYFSVGETVLHALPYHRPPDDNAIAIWHLLVAHGAPINAIDETSRPLLNRAAIRGHWAWVEHLLDAGVVASNLPGANVVDDALLGHHLDVAQRLMQRGFQPTFSSLKSSVAHLYVDQVRFLLDHGPDHLRQPTWSSHPLSALRYRHGSNTRAGLSADQAQAMTDLVALFLPMRDTLQPNLFSSGSLFSFLVEEVPAAPLAALRLAWDYERQTLARRAGADVETIGLDAYPAATRIKIFAGLLRYVRTLDLEALLAFEDWGLDLSRGEPFLKRSLVQAFLKRHPGAEQSLPDTGPPSDVATRLWSFLMRLDVDLNLVDPLSHLPLLLETFKLAPRTGPWALSSLIDRGARVNDRYDGDDFLIWAAPLDDPFKQFGFGTALTSSLLQASAQRTVAHSLSLCKRLINAGASPLSTSSCFCLTLMPFKTPQFLPLLWSRLDLHPDLTPDVIATSLTQHLKNLPSGLVDESAQALESLIQLSWHDVPLLHSVWPLLLDRLDTLDVPSATADSWRYSLNRWTLRNHAQSFVTPAAAAPRSRL